MFHLVHNEKWASFVGASIDTLLLVEEKKGGVIFIIGYIEKGLDRPSVARHIVPMMVEPEEDILVDRVINVECAIKTVRQIGGFVELCCDSHGVVFSRSVGVDYDSLLCPVGDLANKIKGFLS